MDYAKRLQVAEWLNTLGYDIEFDKDGLWMEEYIWQEHKTKDVIDIILNWNEKNLKPNELRAVNRNEAAKEVFCSDAYNTCQYANSEGKCIYNRHCEFQKTD
jgi:hypothetical protein